MFLLWIFSSSSSFVFFSLKRYFPYLNISLPFLFYSSSLPQKNVFLLNIFCSFSISCAKRYFPFQIFPSFPFPCFFSARKKIIFIFQIFSFSNWHTTALLFDLFDFAIESNFFTFSLPLFHTCQPNFIRLLTLPLEVIVGEVFFISPTLQSQSSELNMWWESMVDTCQLGF